jgi:hypothetical protein
MLTSPFGCSKKTLSHLTATAIAVREMYYLWHMTEINDSMNLCVLAGDALSITKSPRENAHARQLA